MWTKAPLDTQYKYYPETRTLIIDWTRGPVDTLLHFLFIPGVIHIGNLIKAFIIHRHLNGKPIKVIKGISQGGSVGIALWLWHRSAVVETHGAHGVAGILYFLWRKAPIINYINGNDLVTKILKPVGLFVPGKKIYYGAKRKWFIFSWKDHILYKGV